MTELDSALPDLDETEERRLIELLQSAYAPREIDLARHERLLEAALEDPFAPASAEELVESERLRDALDGKGDHADAALARALAAAFSPSRAPPRAAPQLAPAPLPARAPARSNVRYLRFAGAGAAVLAAAAAVLLSISPSPRPASEATPDLPALALAQSRSTAPLFQADVAVTASSRIDRIASARGRELRDNRYALWGVR